VNITFLTGGYEMAYTDVAFKFKKLGKNVRIGRNVYFRHPHLIEIGNNVIIDDFTYFTTRVTIGNNVHIAPFVSSIGGSSSELFIGSYCSIAAGVRFVCLSDNFRSSALTNPTIPEGFRDDGDRLRSIVVEKHVIIGTNSVVLPGAHLCEGASIGAMSLVKGTVEPWSLCVGNPLRKLDTRDGEKIREAEKRYEEYINGQHME
jgi:acetyltransferase-like isoleucine patch superfamily enzyme